MSLVASSTRIRHGDGYSFSSKPTAEIRQYEANLVFRGGLVTPNSLEKFTYHIAV
jgi:hypothetical protein